MRFFWPALRRARRAFRVVAPPPHENAAADVAGKPPAALRRARTLLPLLRDERLAVLGREVQRLLAVPPTGRRAGRKP